MQEPKTENPSEADGEPRLSSDPPSPQTFRTDRLVFVPIALVLMFIAFALGRASGDSLNSLIPTQSSAQTDNGQGLYQEVFSLINNQYVEPIEQPEELIYGALNGMVTTLRQEPYEDPYSGFFSPDDYEALQTSTSGNYVGIGVEITQDRYSGYPEVVRVFRDTPAQEAGLQEGDRIIEVNGEGVRDQPLQLTTEKIKGEEGTTVDLTLSRPGQDEDVETTVERRQVHINAVESSEMLGDTTGYIKLTTFNEDATGEVRQSIENLREQGMEGLILDLRGNTGGLLSEAIRLSSLFLDDEDTVVQVKKRDQEPSEYTAGDMDNGGEAVDLPLVILVNGSSASASEVVSGALRDHDRATIIGEKTFGKGVVQEVKEVGDGSMAVLLTVAKYLTPSGESIHGEGIYPNIPFTQWNLLQRDDRARELYQQLAEKRSELRQIQQELSDQLENNDLVRERGTEILEMKLEGEELPEYDSQEVIEEDQQKLRDEFVLPLP